MEKYYRLEDIAKTVCEEMDLSTEEWDEVAEAIERVPTEDVMTVRHGHWIKHGYVCGETEYECSECHETEWRTSDSRMKWCMFCGAKMDGDADNGKMDRI